MSLSMFDMEAVYRRSPVALQHAMATGFGIRERVLRYTGRYKEFCTEIDRGQWLSAEELAQVQAARLRAIVSFSVEHVPHYRKLFADLGLTPADITCPADLAQLPVLTKDSVRDDPESFRPERLSEKVVAQSTGGTTGTPLRYWVTPTAMQYTYATYEVRFRHWAGVALGDRMASINGREIVPAGQQGAPFWRHNLAFNQLYLSAYHLTEEYLPAYVERLERYRPEVIVGYVSSVHLLADHINRHHLQGVIRPRAVLVSSETLFPWIRADIEKAFGCKVFDGYGLGELAAFISECDHGSLHVSPEYGVVESVATDGERHRLVATGLFNLAMPLLRYDTGDIIRLAEPGRSCSCGRQLPVVDELLGRADDYLVTPDGRSVGPAPLSLAFQGVSGLVEAQIRQDEVSAILVSLVVGPDFDDDSQRVLDRELRARLGTEITINYDRVDAITRTTWGKRRLVDSRIKQAEPSNPQ